MIDEGIKTEIAICIAGNVDSGKCFGPKTPVLKYDGSVAYVEDLKVGDQLLGDDSTARNILEVHQGIGQLYKIITSDNYTNNYVVNGEHILCLKYVDKKSIYYNKSKNYYYFRFVTFEKNMINVRHQYIYIKNYISRESAFMQAKILMDDGNKFIRNRLIDGDIVEISVNNYLKLKDNQARMFKWYRTDVDTIYKFGSYGSREDRLKLLNEIMEKNGQYDKGKNYLSIKLDNGQPLDDTIYLVRSLGLSIYHLSNNISNNIIISFGGIGQERILNSKVASKNNLITDITITKENIGQYYGFELDGNGRFLLGDFSVAHNSTFIGVMKYGELDDGNGSARIKVAKHPHERDSGKTSDISTRLLVCDDKKHGVTFVDLCGHEKYLKTTTYGINGYWPDYSFSIIAANRGVMRMTREHLGILFYLEIPTLILITRVDLVAGSDIYTNTLNTIIKICKRNRKQVIVLNSDKEFNLSPEQLKIKEQETCVKIMSLIETIKESSNIVPILTISCKTGYFLNTIKTFINNVKPRKLWDAETMEGSIFYIDHVFNPVGIGVVISGIVKGKAIKIGSNLYIGPNGKDFIMVKVRSIHNDNRQDMQELKDHERGCLAIACVDKKIDFNKTYIKKGMIAVNPENYTSKICYRFKAEIDILHHSATIKTNYSPFIHAGPVCQTARLTINKDENNGKESLCTGDTAIVDFKFKFKPEFIETFEETKKYFFFREGTTRGRGKILLITKIVDDPDPTPDLIYKKRKIKVRGHRRDSRRTRRAYNKQNKISNLN